MCVCVSQGSAVTRQPAGSLRFPPTSSGWLGAKPLGKATRGPRGDGRREREGTRETVREGERKREREGERRKEKGGLLTFHRPIQMFSILCAVSRAEWHASLAEQVSKSQSQVFIGKGDSPIFKSGDLQEPCQHHKWSLLASHLAYSVGC